MTLLLLLSCLAPVEDTDTDTDADTDVLEAGDVNWVGSAHVVVGTSWLGAETRTVVATDTVTVLCEETYALAGSRLDIDCPDCTFAFSLEVTDVVVDEGDRCAAFGVGTDAWSQEMDPGLGWDQTTGYMAYQDQRYAWDVVEGTTASWTGDSVEGDLSWDWNWMERDFYGYE